MVQPGGTSLRGLALIMSLLVATSALSREKLGFLTPAAAQAWKQGQSALFFHDPVEQIRYAKDIYFVLGVSQSATTGAYGGLWEPSKPMSALNAEEFSKLGVKTVSLYDLFPADEIANLVAAETAKFDVSKMKDYRTPPRSEGGLAEELRSALLAKGMEYLVWVNWDGFLLLVPSLGMKPFEQMTVGYRIFDLHKNQMIAYNDILFMERVELEGATPKEFLERNELQRLKTDVDRLMRSRFTSTDLGTIGLAPKRTTPQLLGLEPVKRVQRVKRAEPGSPN
jgi:hypothetical protein